MRGRHGWMAAVVAAAALIAAPGQAQDRSCDEGRGGIMTDLGFDRIRLSTDHRDGRVEVMGFAEEPRVTGVRANGPAAVRLRDGDLLVAIDGQPVATTAGARRYAGIEPGDQVRLSVRRGEEVQEVTITAQERCIPHPPAPPVAPLPPLPPGEELMPEGWLGFQIGCQNCGDDDNGEFRFREPPLVVEVQRGSPAARAGIRPGDRLTHLDGVPLTSAAGWPRLSEIQPGQEVCFTYTRGGKTESATFLARRRP